MTTDDKRDPRAARERLELAIGEARELVDTRAQACSESLVCGRALSHPIVITARARLSAALADLAALELLLERLTRPTDAGGAAAADTDIPPLVTRKR